jgi:hypothetical protein
MSRLVTDITKHGGVVKERKSPLPRSTQDTPIKHTQIPINLLTTQDHKGERMSQV